MADETTRDRNRVDAPTSPRRWVYVLAGCVAVLVLCAGGLVLAVALDRGGSNAHAQHYADRMGVHGGYVRIDDYNGGDGSCGCDLARWYIGPVGADPTVVFTGPGLSLTPPSTSYQGDLWQFLVSGQGYTDATGRCDVVVERLSHARDLYDYPDLWHLTHQEVDRWKHGDLDVLQLSLLCDADATTNG